MIDDENLNSEGLNTIDPVQDPLDEGAGDPADPVEGEAANNGQTETEGGAEDAEEVLVFGDGADAEDPEDEFSKAFDDVEVRKKLRKRDRDKERKIKQLEAELAKMQNGGQAQPDTLPPRPSRADFEWDDEGYDAALEQWYDQKTAYEQRQAEVRREAEAEQQAFNERLQKYREDAKRFPAEKFTEAEEEVAAALKSEQQGAILAYSADPAKFILALGQNPTELKKLQSIKNPGEFLWRAAQLEASMKTAPKRKAPPPEKRLDVAPAAGGGGQSAALAKLEEEAAKSGDYTKYHREKMRLAQNR